MKPPMKLPAAAFLVAWCLSCEQVGQVRPSDAEESPAADVDASPDVAGDTSQPGDRDASDAGAELRVPEDLRDASLVDAERLEALEAPSEAPRPDAGPETSAACNAAGHPGCPSSCVCGSTCPAGCRPECASCGACC